jgi:hypothetical protein
MIKNLIALLFTATVALAQWSSPVTYTVTSPSGLVMQYYDPNGFTTTVSYPPGAVIASASSTYNHGFFWFSGGNTAPLTLRSNPASTLYAGQDLVVELAPGAAGGYSGANAGAFTVSVEPTVNVYCGKPSTQASYSIIGNLRYTVNFASMGASFNGVEGEESYISSNPIGTYSYGTLGTGSIIGTNPTFTAVYNPPINYPTPNLRSKKEQYSTFGPSNSILDVTFVFNIIEVTKISPPTLPAGYVTDSFRVSHYFLSNPHPSYPGENFPSVLSIDNHTVGCAIQEVNKISIEKKLLRVVNLKDNACRLCLLTALD